MASEPGAGPQKKLHPFFTPLEAGQTEGGGAGEARPEANQAINQASEPALRHEAAREPPLDPRLFASDTNTAALVPSAGEEAGGPAATGATLTWTTKADTAPAAEPPVVPVQESAFARLQAKRKPDDSLADILADGGPKTPEPRRRGRPPKKRKPSPAASGIASHFVREGNEAPSSLSTGPDSHGETSGPAITDGSPVPSSFAPSTITNTPTDGAKSSAPIEDQSASTQPPKRLLQFNPKTGTIGSPPKPKGKGKLSAAVTKPLVISYGQQDAAARSRIGAMIDDILAGKHRVFAPQPSSEPKLAKRGPKPSKSTAPVSKQPLVATSTTPKPAQPTTKSTHPFFTGARPRGPAANADPSNTSSASKSSAGASSTKYYTSTPCSPKRPRGVQPSSGFRMPQFGAKNGILRVPGACLPAWPWKGAVHVRPDGDTPLLHTAQTSSSLSTLPVRKRKGNAVAIHVGESILEQQMQSLNIALVRQEIRNANADDFSPAPSELRLPQKHVESGKKLQARVAPQLRTDHPGLQSLFASISTTLSAFDQHTCEALSWTQKYAPSCAVEVLQSGREPLMLRDWLAALKVVSVDTGPGESGDNGGSGSKAGPWAKAKPKRRRKKNKLDGFIVSSEDEDDDMGEASDNEADWSASGRYGLQKKTVIRAGGLLDKVGREGARLTNAVVISGPHGCGKSAAVYAVAKELGFEVFEISASSRRSGKDVIDRIGDMTRNHLVQHKKHKLPKAAPSAEADGLVDEGDASTSDLEDAEGDPDPDFPAPVATTTINQPTMSSFFKPKAPAAAKPGNHKQADETPATATNAKGTPQSQKQSLILLEEADILYDEDKQFWATVMGLILQSKRPFVITCNDETLIPLQSLRLHGIFRFTPPPTDVAVDRLLMVAACEGHVLQRQAVQSLYEARDYDFRASLADLQFWCQFAVGDRRGSFDWFYQRWPEGVDLDEEQQVRRVVSEGTYQEGMGWLNHDAPAAAKSSSGASNTGHHPPAVEDGLVQQAWNDWQLDMGQWQDSLGLTAWAYQLDPPEPSTAAGRRRLLESYGQFADAMSDADMVSAMVFATGDKTPFDATQPELPHKARDDYILGLQLLERTIAAHENDALRLPMATAMRCKAKLILKAETSASSAVEETHKRLDCLDETRVMTSIRKQHAEDHRLVPCDDTPAIGRIDFSLAFDPIAVASSARSGSGYYAGYAASGSSSSPSYLDPSVFDRNFGPIVVDVAPFVRGILAYEKRLREQRLRLGTFLSEASSSSAAAAAAAASPASMTDGEAAGSASASTTRRPAKRMRTTRTALSALEGGSRSATRDERWFYADINPALVMRTGGDGWDRAAEDALARADKELAAAAAAVVVPPPPSTAIEQHSIDAAPFPTAATASSATAEAEMASAGARRLSAGQARSRRRDVVVSSPGGPEGGMGEGGAAAAAEVAASPRGADSDSPTGP